MWRADRTEPSSYFLPPACYLVTSQLLLVKLTATKCMPNVTEDVSAGEPGVCLLPRDLIINRSRDTKTACYSLVSSNVTRIQCSYWLSIFTGCCMLCRSSQALQVVRCHVT